MQHWTKRPVCFQLLEFQLQFIIIIIIIINRYWFLRFLCEHVHAHLTSLACTEKSTTNGATFTGASFTTRCAPISHHLQDSNCGRQGSLWHSRGLQVVSVVLPTMRQGIDRGHCDLNWCLPMCSTFCIFSKCLGGMWTAQFQSRANISLYILIRTSRMLAHLLKPLPWQASMNDAACSSTIASSACVSPIACSGSLAVLATLSALIFPMPNVAADVSAPVRAWMASRSGTIDVCTFTLCMMSITARSFTVEHMQSWSFGFISATTWRSRAKTSVSSQITDTTSQTMHLVIAWCTIIVSASSWFRGRSSQTLWHLLFQQGHLRY